MLRFLSGCNMTNFTCLLRHFKKFTDDRCYQKCIYYPSHLSLFCVFSAFIVHCIVYYFTVLSNFTCPTKSTKQNISVILGIHLFSLQMCSVFIQLQSSLHLIFMCNEARGIASQSIAIIIQALLWCNKIKTTAQAEDQDSQQQQQ